jgi:aspartate racemase
MRDGVRDWTGPTRPEFAPAGAFDAGVVPASAWWAAKEAALARSGAPLRHIGIAAASPEGGALCYRQIARHAARLLAPDAHPVVSVFNLPLTLYLAAVRKDDWREVGRLLRVSAEKLSQMGAEVCLTPDNAIQHGVHIAEIGSPIPWLRMPEIVAAALQADQRRQVGVIGTRSVTTGSAYQMTLGVRGIKVLAPEAADADAMDGIIFGELVYGKIVPESVARLQSIIRVYKDRGCDAVVLGCSEAPLAIGRTGSPLPVYDSLDLLAEHAVRGQAAAVAETA